MFCLPHYCFPIVQHAVLCILCPKQEPTYLDTKAECGLVPCALYPLLLWHHSGSGTAHNLLRSLSPSPPHIPHVGLAVPLTVQWRGHHFPFFSSTAVIVSAFCQSSPHGDPLMHSGQTASFLLFPVLDLLCLETFTEASPPCEISPESRPISTTVFLSLHKTYNSDYSILQTSGLPVLSKHISEPLTILLLFLVLPPRVEFFPHPLILHTHI